MRYFESMQRWNVLLPEHKQPVRDEELLACILCFWSVILALWAHPPQSRLRMGVLRTEIVISFTAPSALILSGCWRRVTEDPTCDGTRLCSEPRLACL